MFALADLTLPFIAAPMAGGPSTPKLVSAAVAAGGTGFLAAGYKSPADVADEIDRTRALGAEAFGVNLFLPGEPTDLDAALAYRARLAPLAADLGVELPEPRQDDDAFDAKVEVLLDAAVPAVSFTFGCPPAEVVRRFRNADTFTIGTVTSTDEARQAAASGVDALVVQGPDAGGHRATFDPAADAPAQPLVELLQEVHAATGLPLIASGGLGTPEAIRGALTRADAVQLGTAFLDADEAGTSAPYRAALHDPRFTETAVTRAFSGRLARGLRNSFIDEHGADAPAAYPAVNQLTGPIRRAATAAGDPELLSLWAGTAWRHVPTGPVADIVATLVPSR